MKRHQKIITISILLFGIILKACTPLGFTRLGNGGLEHTFSGIDFPKEIGKFYRTPIQNYDYLGKNVGVGYNLRSQECNVTFTIFIYPHNNEDINKEFENVINAIKHYHKDTKIINEENVYYTQDSLKVKGLSVTCRYTQKMINQEILVISQAYIFKYNDNFIKYRITYPDYYENCAQSELKLLFENLKWNLF